MLRTLADYRQRTGLSVSCNAAISANTYTNVISSNYTITTTGSIVIDQTGVVGTGGATSLILVSACNAVLGPANPPTISYDNVFLTLDYVAPTTAASRTATTLATVASPTATATTLCPNLNGLTYSSTPLLSYSIGCGALLSNTGTQIGSALTVTSLATCVSQCDLSATCSSAIYTIASNSCVLYAAPTLGTSSLCKYSEAFCIIQTLANSFAALNANVNTNVALKLGS